MAQAQGVNVVGFFRAEFGQGEAARRVLSRYAKQRAVLGDQLRPRAAPPGAPVRGQRQARVRSQPALSERGAPAPVRAGRRRGLLRRRSAAGLWFWEGSRMPRELRPAIDLLDEIWVASDFVAQTIALETDKPVLTFPLP